MRWRRATNKQRGIYWNCGIMKINWKNYMEVSRFFSSFLLAINKLIVGIVNPHQSVALSILSLYFNWVIVHNTLKTLCNYMKGSYSHFNVKPSLRAGVWTMFTVFQNILDRTRIFKRWQYSYQHNNILRPRNR